MVRPSHVPVWRSRPLTAPGLPLVAVGRFLTAQPRARSAVVRINEDNAGLFTAFVNLRVDAVANGANPLKPFRFPPERVIEASKQYLHYSPR
jgi:hypothetical protein